MSRDSYIEFDGVPVVTTAEWQYIHKQWLNHNFPDATALQQAMGMVEEMGELYHCLLKLEQGIRQTEDHEAMKRDAIGDMFMYMLGFCTRSNISISQCIEEAWKEISQRDWIKYPKDGRTS